MSDTLTTLKNQFEQHKGEYIIVNDRVERFVGIGSDSEDYYYLTYNGKQLKWNHCLSGFVVLKGKIDNKDYNEFIRLAKLNDYHYLIAENKRALNPKDYFDFINLYIKGLEGQLNDEFLTKLHLELPEEL